MRNREISNTDDVIDSREIIARIEELEGELETVKETPIESSEDYGTREEEWLNTTDEGRELVTLRALQSEAEDYSSDWRYGATLVRDTYFTDYAEEMVKDCEGLPRDIPSYIVIDWEATAENVKADYTSVDFNGVAYWVR